MLTIRHGDDDGASFYANVVTFGFNSKTRRASFIQLVCEDKKLDHTIDQGAVAVLEHGRELASYVANAEPSMLKDGEGGINGARPGTLRPHPHLTPVS